MAFSALHLHSSIKWFRAPLGGVLLVLFASSIVRAQSDIDLTGYTLVFSDEFTSASWTPNNPKGPYTWRSQPPKAGDVFGYSIRDQTCLSISNGVLINKLKLVAGLDSSGSYCGGPVGMKDGSGTALVTAGTLGSQVNTHSGWQWYGWIGMRFTTPSGGLTVSQLGRYAIANNTKIHQVRIFDAITGDDVAKAVVNCAGQSGWVYAPIIGGNKMLAGSHAYYLMTDNYSGEDYFYSGATTVSATGGVTINNSAWGGWHSGSLYSMDATPAGFALQYGYFEMRAKMPASGVGSWPSFWCRVTNQITGATCNEEIDILEWYGGSYDGNSDCAQQVSHNWGSGCPNDQSVYNPCVHVAGARPWADYHIYGFESDPSNITFYIDGVQSLRCATPTHYLTCGLDLRLEYALGGGWPLTNVVANSHYDIDWVRVWALPAPTALFSAAPTNGSAPLTVTFTDNSTGFITNRTWSFGDGTTTNRVTGGSVTHTYASPGTYSVHLIVAGPGGATTNTRPNYLEVSQLPPSPLYWTNSGSQLSLNWSNGTGILVASTNVALPSSNWTPLVTNPAMPYVIAISSSVPQTFYRVK